MSTVFERPRTPDEAVVVRFSERVEVPYEDDIQTRFEELPSHA